MSGFANGERVSPSAEFTPLGFLIDEPPSPGRGYEMKLVQLQQPSELVEYTIALDDDLSRSDKTTQYLIELMAESSTPTRGRGNA
jgi:hypothetical protein